MTFGLFSFNSSGGFPSFTLVAIFVLMNVSTALAMHPRLYSCSMTLKPVVILQGELLYNLFT